jgi:hypothetical protein
VPLAWGYAVPPAACCCLPALLVPAGTRWPACLPALVPALVSSCLPALVLTLCSARALTLTLTAALPRSRAGTCSPTATASHGHGRAHAHPVLVRHALRSALRSAAGLLTTCPLSVRPHRPHDGHRPPAGHKHEHDTGHRPHHGRTAALCDGRTTGRTSTAGAPAALATSTGLLST